MDYVGFKRRVAASFIDFIIYIPMIVGLNQLHSLSKPAYFTILTLDYISYPLYFIYFHRRWGQTIGKMILKIKVVKIDGAKLDWNTAALRSLPDILWTLLMLPATYLTLTEIPESQFSALSWADQSALIDQTMRPSLQWVLYGYILWGLTDTLTILLNKKRRALHDFLAGTVVIKKS